MGLHTKVPAVFETIAGNPASRNAATAALTGSLVKYAAGPVATIGRSIGCCPSLSGIRASSTLIATRSSDNSARPPASPTHSTMSGCVAAIASSSAAIARPNTVGTMRVSIVRSSSRDGSRNTASPEGLIASAPNGSNPVTSAFIATNSRTNARDISQMSLQQDAPAPVFGLNRPRRRKQDPGEGRDPFFRRSYATPDGSRPSPGTQLPCFLSFGAAAAGARRYREADKLARALAVQEQQDIAVGGGPLSAGGRLPCGHFLPVAVAGSA